MSRAGTGPQGPPPLLQRLYGAGKVFCLRDLLLDLSNSSRDAQVLRDTLVQPFDHTDYSQTLLSRTYCALKPGAPPLADGFSLQRTSDQLEASDLNHFSIILFLYPVFLNLENVVLQLLHRAIEALLQSQHGKTNVLCYGYRKVRVLAA